MYKILDHLNKRDFKINTVEGAKEAVYNLLENHPNRILHTEGVVRLVKQLCVTNALTEEETNLAIQSAYLHDIGYSEKFKFADFHPVDGYYYLKTNDWNSAVYMTALHHTESRLLAHMSRYDLISFYSTVGSASERDAKIIDLVTQADLQVSPTGEIISVEERVYDIRNRYGSEHVITKHIEKVYQIIGPM